MESIVDLSENSVVEFHQQLDQTEHFWCGHQPLATLHSACWWEF